MKVKPYTKEELDEIRRLHKEGYSATLILEKIGRPRSLQASGQWLIHMRKRLGLPKRGVGFVGIRKTDVDPSRDIKRRLEKIPVLLKHLEIRRKDLVDQREQLERKLRRLEKR